MLTDAARDRIRTVRTFGPVRDPLAWRRSVERAFAGAALHASGLPTRGILCVRRLRLRAPVRESDLARRLDERLDALVAEAARPLAHPVPANAVGVLFMDEAELLACLVRDWALDSGCAWWWTGLFGASASLELVRRALLGTPTHVPAALELLAADGAAVAAVRALPVALCEEVAVAVARAFGVASWISAPGGVAAASAEANAPTRTGPTSHDIGLLHAAVRDVAAADRSEALNPPRRALLALSFVLRRAPALARCGHVIAMLRDEDWSRVHAIAPVAPSWSARGAGTGTVGGLDDRESATSRGAKPTVAKASRGVVAAVGSPASPSAASDSWTDELRDASSSAAPTVSTAAAAPGPAPASEARAEATLVVHSELAGIFYVVNLALQLELYADFTQPLRADLGVPLGDFLALVGERACGESIRDDPVWTVLASMAGRAPDEEPASGFVPLDGAERDAWLSALTERLDARATLALGHERDALAFVCRRRGRLALTATRLSVTFELARHPLAIRVAGLDRDCGWVPAAGRIIEFVYE